MPKLYKPDRPMSPVQQALTVFPFKQLADALNLTRAQINQWARLDRIPKHHVAAVARLTNRDPLVILEYQERKARPWPQSSPQTRMKRSVRSLLEPPQTLPDKIAQGKWGECAPTLVETLTQLDQTFDSYAAAAKAKHAAAKKLGVTYRQINRLCDTYSINPRYPTPEYLKRAEEAGETRKERLHAAALCVMGKYNAVEAAKTINVSARTIFRYIEDTATAHYGLSLVKINKLPASFRAALAHDVENDTYSPVFARILSLWSQKRLKLAPKPTRKSQNSWKRESIPTSLSYLLRYETDIETLSRDKETSTRNLELLFTAYLRPYLISFNDLKDLTLYHHEALADAIDAVETQSYPVSKSEPIIDHDT